MSSSTNVGTSDKVDLPIDYDTENLVGHWGETLNDFSEDGENIVPITEVDDVRLLDVDDVEIVRTIATAGNGVDVEDDVWDAVVARLGLVNDKSVWGYVEPEPNQLEHIYPAYEPPAHMYEVNYAAMRDREHEVRIFASSSASNYDELELKALFEKKKDAQMMFDHTVEGLVLFFVDAGACSKQYSVQMSLLRCADMRSHQLLDIYELVVPKDY
ncbi:hypothetical protein V6N13_001077 [Hibiscus sabdariffa]